MQRHHSVVTIRKIRAAQMGKNNSFYGKAHTKEAKARISRKTSGKNNPMYGKRHSPQVRRKISLAIRRARLKRA